MAAAKQRGGRPARPIPEGFADAVWKPTSELTELYATSPDTITRWRKQLGAANPYMALMEPPADFAVEAAHRNLSMLCAHYKVGERRIKSWAKRAGVTLRLNLSPRRRGAPEDFAQLAPTMTQLRLCKHYHADTATVKRWLAETGAASFVYVPRKRQAPRPFVIGGHARNQQARDLRHVTMYDEAADVLRRERFVVYRCDERGRADQKGQFWRLGNTLLTPDDLIQRAAKYHRRVA